MKISIRKLVALTGLLFAGTVLAGGGVAPSVSVGSGGGNVGSATPVVIDMNWNPDSTVALIQFDIVFDSTNLTWVSSNCSNVPLNMAFSEFIIFDIACTPVSPGQIRVVVRNDQNNPIILFNGPFAQRGSLLGQMTFDISGAAIGQYSLVVTEPIVFGDSSAEPVAHQQSPEDNGLITISAGPQAAWSASPGALNFGTRVVDTGSYTATETVTNTGQQGSTLTGNCGIKAGSSSVFGISGSDNLGAGLAMGASQGIDVTCNTAGAAFPQVHTGTLECSSNGGDNEYALTCNIEDGPKPTWGSTPAPGNSLPTLGPVEQNDPNPTPVALNVQNVGAAGGLTGNCVAGAPFIVTGGSVGPLAVSATAQVTVGCNATASQGTYNDSLTCTHSGNNGPSASYPISCIIDPPGLAQYASTPAPGNVPMTPGGDVLTGSSVPSIVLTVSNAAQAGDQNLSLSGCDWNGAHDGLTAAAIGQDSLSPGGSDTASTTFGCDTASPGQKSGTYQCSYSRDGGFETGAIGGGSNEVANYNVTCGVRLPESEVFADPSSGTPLPTINVPPGDSGTTKVRLSENFGDLLAAGIDSCFMDDGTNFQVISPSFSYNLPGGGSVDIVVQGTAPATLGEYNDTLICNYNDTQCRELSGTDESGGCPPLSWPVTMVVADPAPIPTMSEWSRLLMILALLGLGGLFLRRKVGVY